MPSADAHLHRAASKTFGAAQKAPEDAVGAMEVPAEAGLVKKAGETGAYYDVAFTTEGK